MWVGLAFGDGLAETEPTAFFPRPANSSMGAIKYMARFTCNQGLSDKEAYDRVVHACLNHITVLG
jgi:hypothetical protein